MKDVDYKFDQGKASVYLDSDNDGVPSLELEADLKELVEEIVSRGDGKEGVKTATFKMEGMQLLIEIDSDKDGEKSFVFKANLPEGFDEGMKRVN